jgi:adenosine deaminase CECR1
VDEPTKNRLLAEYDKRIAAFVGQYQKSGWGSLKNVKPVTYSFICKHYSVCFK